MFGCGNVVNIVDRALNRVVRTIRGHSSTVFRLQMCKDILATASWDSTVRVWRLDNKVPVVLPRHGSTGSARSDQSAEAAPRTPRAKRPSIVAARSSLSPDSPRRASLSPKEAIRRASISPNHTIRRASISPNGPIRRDSLASNHSANRRRSIAPPPPPVDAPVARITTIQSERRGSLAARRSSTVPTQI